ncbi:EAL domain-containing protein [Sporosarcina sp. Te-1]|nr:EAL domain-containing protein [Sporosarcina sp. Te-1]
MADETALTIVQAIIDIGVKLEMEIVIEGIEEETQAAVLAKYHRGLIGQGYFFGKPMSAESFEEMLHKERPKD